MSVRVRARPKAARKMAVRMATSAGAMPFAVRAVLAGCGDVGRTESAPTVTDSAGVRVVRHRGPPSLELALGGEPELVVGASPDGANALHRVRGGALLVADSLPAYRALQVDSDARVRVKSAEPRGTSVEGGP